MAAFHSLTPPMGSHQNRRAPDMLSVELELILPQDHFLPAEDIQAQVWTNILHKLNPDGPEVWSAIPMKLSHVIPGKGIAVFAARFQPTGRGDFGLTARWKSHKDMTEWQWAPTEETVAQQANKDVSVTVRIPRNISGSSSWTMGPQSIMVFGPDGPRVEGNGAGSGIGGPGLYLGNHAAATRARISGYEAVLSLVGDLLDFDEKIPESDKELNKNAWIEQAQAGSPPKRFSSISRSSSITSYSGSISDLAHEREGSHYSNQSRTLARGSSVQDFMINHEPGLTSDKILAAVVDEPVDPPRLTRRSSVTDMMVQAPSTANSTKRLSRSSVSSCSFVSIVETEPGLEQEVTPAGAALTPAALSAGSKSVEGAGAATAPASQGKKSGAAAAAAAPPVSSSKKSVKSSSTANNGAATLPPVSNGKSTKTGSTLQKQAATSPTISSLEVAAAPDANSSSITGSSGFGTNGGASKKEGTVSATESNVATGSLDSSSKTLGSNSANTPGNLETPPSSFDNSAKPSITKVVSGLYRQSWESQQALTSLSSLASSTSASATTTTSVQPPVESNANSQQENEQPRRPFQHKMISLAPGAHSIISDAVLKDAVEFLRTQIEQGKKVLVHCRDGNGRSGSVAVAYVASQLQRKAKREVIDVQDGGGGYYDEALNEIWKWKCDVYPHKGLRQSVEKIQW